MSRRPSKKPKPKVRAFVKHETATVGSGPAMISSSQVPFKVGELVYTVGMDDAYIRANRYGDSVEIYQPTIEAHRVIQVNYQYRTVRLRCVKGCESVLRFNDGGCSRLKYWHTLEEAREELRGKVDAQIEETAKEQAKYQRQLDHMAAAQRRMSRLKPEKLPAEVT